MLAVAGRRWVWNWRAFTTQAQSRPSAIEGRLLFEMLDVRDAHDDAIASGLPLDRLVPTTGVARVLARVHAERAKPQPTTTAKTS